MSGIAATVITASTLVRLVAGALAAGLGVTVAFSLLIYCSERASTLRRVENRGAGVLFQAIALLAIGVVLGIVAYGLILTVSKPK